MCPLGKHGVTWSVNQKCNKGLLTFEKEHNVLPYTVHVYVDCNESRLMIMMYDRSFVRMHHLHQCSHNKVNNVL